MFKSERKIDLSPRLKSAVGRGYSKNTILKSSAILCLIIAFGLTLNIFRVIFNNSKNHTDFQSGKSQVLGATDTEQNKSNHPNFIEYKVKKGDTLFSLSKKFNINWSTIASLNNLKSPFSLKPGQIIKISQ
jgi:hypothetical protein